MNQGDESFAKLVKRLGIMAVLLLSVLGIFLFTEPKHSTAQLSAQDEANSRLGPPSPSQPEATAQPKATVWYAIGQGEASCISTVSPASLIEDERTAGVEPSFHDYGSYVEVDIPAGDGMESVRKFYRSELDCQQSVAAARRELDSLR